jgi:hypothetical protein
MTDNHTASQPAPQGGTLTRVSGRPAGRNTASQSCRQSQYKARSRAMKISREHREIIKQAVAAVLVWIMLFSFVPGMKTNARASNFDSVLEFFIHYLENPIIDHPIPNPFPRMTADALRRVLGEAVAHHTGQPVDSIRFEGERALYTVRGERYIQIGEFLFPRHDPETTVNGQSMVNRLLPYIESGRTARAYYVPFFIYQDELYFLNAAPGNHVLTFGSVVYRLSQPPGWGLLWELTLPKSATGGAAPQSSPPNIHISRDLENFTYDVFHTMPGVTSPETSVDRWINVNEFVRSGHTTVQVGQVRPFRELFGGGTIPRFSINAFGEYGEFGFFYVPPSFHYETGLTLHEYILTLNADTLFQDPPPDSIEHEIPLPPGIADILEDLGDLDEVEIEVCPETGKVTFIIIPHVPDPKCCCYDDTEVLSILGQILAELKNILTTLQEISYNTRIFRDSGGSNNGGGSDNDDVSVGLFRSILNRLTSIRNTVNGISSTILSGTEEILTRALASISESITSIHNTVNGISGVILGGIEEILIRLFVPSSESLKAVIDPYIEDISKIVGIENIEAFIGGFQKLNDINSAMSVSGTGVLGATVDIEEQTLFFCRDPFCGGYDCTDACVNWGYPNPLCQWRLYDQGMKVLGNSRQDDFLDVFDFEIFGVTANPLRFQPIRDVFAWFRAILRVLFWFLFIMVTYRRLIYVLNKGSVFERAASGLGMGGGGSNYESTTQRQFIHESDLPSGHDRYNK